MAAETSGTFGATGQSATVTVRSAIVGIDGGATATIIVQVSMGGVWYDVQTITADSVYVIEFPMPLDLRLNCTSYTSGTVTYAVKGKEY